MFCKQNILQNMWVLVLQNILQNMRVLILQNMSCVWHRSMQNITFTHTNLDKVFGSVLGGSSHSFLKITNFPSSGSFQELAWLLEFFFHILENFPGYIVFIIFSQLHLCSNAFLKNFSNSSFKFTFASITFTKQKDKV